jgi:hypothetical protein
MLRSLPGGSFCTGLSDLGSPVETTKLDYSYARKTAATTKTTSTTKAGTTTTLTTTKPTTTTTTIATTTTSKPITTLAMPLSGFELTYNNTFRFGNALLDEFKLYRKTILDMTTYKTFVQTCAQACLDVPACKGFFLRSIPLQGSFCIGLTDLGAPIETTKNDLSYSRIIPRPSPTTSTTVKSTSAVTTTTKPTTKATATTSKAGTTTTTSTNALSNYQLTFSATQRFGSALDATYWLFRKTTLDTSKIAEFTLECATACNAQQNCLGLYS